MNKINLGNIMIGFVVSTDDPESRNRLKIRIPAVHGIESSANLQFIHTKDIPFAVPVNPIPHPYRVGDTIFVTHLEGNYLYPIYF